MMLNEAVAWFSILFLVCAPSSIIATPIDEAGSVKKRGHTKTSIGIVNGVIEECENVAICVLKRFADYVSETREQRAFETITRERLSAQLEAYTCSDPSLGSSKPIRKAPWRDLEVSIMHDRPSSKIHLLQGFIRPQECQAIQEVAQRAKLNPGTVNGIDTDLKIRKVLQASVSIPWNEETQGHPIASVARRVYDYANHVLEGLEIQEHGQQSLKFLSYSGRGRNDTEPDHYASHCDTNCDGSQHVRGGRVATMVMYCETAEDGGYTNFRNAGVHVTAKPGDAIFFTYVDPNTLKKDNGFTRHSGCPVYEGHKKIVTQWIRLGVDKEHPYNTFKNL